MPTKHKRHSVTETPRVRAALDEVRALSGEDSVDLGELVVLGAERKAEELRSVDRDRQRRLEEAADWVRSGDLGMDFEAAQQVRREGWARPL